MMRLKDISKAIDKIWNMDVTDDANYKIAMIALLGHIAVALAVIADKMSEDKAEGSEK